VTSSPTATSEDDDVIGTPEQITEALRQYGHSRVSEFIVRDHRETQVEETLDMMTTLTADVMPRLM
jgi:hypothetical protein